MLAMFGAPVCVLFHGELDETLGVVDVADENDLAAFDGTGLTGKVTAVTVKTGVLRGLAEGATITIDGTDYRVISQHQQGDGALTRVLCARD